MVKIYCTNCSKKCIGDVLKVGNKYFHQICFKCKDCNSYLDTGGFFFRNGDYYCPKDYTLRFSNKCFICSNLIESEVVSALNNHFHRNCFKCNVCSKIFSPGDRVTMKHDRFVCQICLSNNELDLDGIRLKESDNLKVCDPSPKKELLSDDALTDQGYISADPTSLSYPTPSNGDEKLLNCSPNKVNKRTKSRSSLTHSLFEFGKFYKSSYLNIQELRQKERQIKSNKSSSRTSTYQFSNNFHLPLSKNQCLKSQNKDLSPGRLGIDCAINSNLIKVTSASESDVNEKENIIRLSSYPAGEKPEDSIPVALERDDWPAPLSTTILLHEKMLRKREFFGTNSAMETHNIPGDNITDYTQSLDHLVYDTSCREQRNLIEVLRDSPSHKSHQQSDADVISASRSPNANKEPSSKTRYSNHRDKSKSRDSTYFNDAKRHIGYSLEFVSSTTRPFLAGRVPYGLKPGYTQGVLHDIKNRTSVEPRTSDNTNNNNKRGNEVSYTWTAVRTMSDSFDVQLKNIEYDSTLDETLFDNPEELSYSDVDLVTGLKKTKSRSWKDRSKEPNATSDKSSINSKIESLETWSFWSQRPLPVNKSSTVPYYDIVSKNPKSLRGLDSNRLETYLSTEEFVQMFNLSRADFYRLPEWKQNDLKRRVHLF